MFQLYICVGHGSQGVVGLGLLGTGIVPAWVAWLAVAFGVAGFLSQLPGFSRLPFLRRVFEVPLVMHAVPALIGVSLLLR